MYWSYIYLPLTHRYVVYVMSTKWDPCSPFVVTKLYAILCYDVNCLYIYGLSVLWVVFVMYVIRVFDNS